MGIDRLALFLRHALAFHPSVQTMDAHTKPLGMSGKRYTEEFKIAAVKQVSQRGHSVSDVALELEVM
jgi:hypothetical protein